MGNSKGKGRIVEEVFTTDGKRYQVKANVLLNDLRQALALRAIITSFETSAMKREQKGGKGIISPTKV